MKLLPTDVIYALNKRFLSDYPFIKGVVFDPESSYSNSIMYHRTMDSMPKSIEFPSDRQNELPLLSWNRGTIRSSTNRNSTLYNMSEKHKDRVDFVLVEFDYDFNLFTTNIAEIETFELQWLLRQGLRSINRIVINAGIELGSFEYNVNWKPELASLSFSIDNNYYKSISGSAVISGVFLYSNSMSDKELGSQINSININLTDCHGNELTDNSITKLGT